MNGPADEAFEFFYRTNGFGPGIQSIEVPEAVIFNYQRKVPEQLLTYWRTYGWSGYGNGLFRLVDPRDYAEVVSAWIQGTELQGRDRFHVIGRSAFGKLYVWGEKTGRSITIDSALSMIFPADHSIDVANGESDHLIRTWLAALSKRRLDESDINEEPLFDRAVKLLGRPGPDEMFGFVPALALGGPCRLDHLQKVKAVEHLMFLAQVQPPRLMLDIVQEAKKQGLM
ncbi:GAD-like domain protein [compost metagenome]